MAKFKVLLLLLICLAWITPGQALTPATAVVVYEDALAPGWENWSWAQVDLSAADPVHDNAHSIAVTFGAWEGLYLHNADVDTSAVSALRFYVHGGASGGQQINVYLNLRVNGGEEVGPQVSVPPPAAGAWLEVRIPLVELNPQGAAVTGITWQAASGGDQPTVYFDDIALVSDEHPEGPQLSAASLFPRSIPADGSTILVVRARVSDPQGAGDLASVTLDASSLGAGPVLLRDDGRSNDLEANDGLYGAALSVAPSTPSGEQHLALVALDRAGHRSSLPLGALAILAPPGGGLPPVLPQRIGWGSSAWDEQPGEDWQVNSGVPWDYVYQYITYGWEAWGGSFVRRFVQQAWDKEFIPVVTVYMVLGVPPGCGEGGLCYAEKLQNAAAVQAYLESLLRAAQEATGSQPVIFNLEPDFYGYMQQLSNSDQRPPGVRPDDPSSYLVALNKSGYPNNLAGFGRYLVDLIHATAPNALVAPMASKWSTNADLQSVTPEQAIQMGQRTAAFIDAMGGTRADLLVVEWSDRDAGSGQRPWWDDTDYKAPRPNRAILWENALSRAASKRLLLWQVPVGNMSLDNTCDHYQDNRAAYLFNHPRDIFDAGVVGILFGGGAICMTSVETDGGFVAAQGAIAYAAPAAPVGLAGGVAGGLIASLRWDENSEPDLWGYRILYRQLPGGAQHTVDVGRRSALNLLLPQPGEWEIRLAAVDAMGSQSQLSPALTLNTAAEALEVYLPFVTR